MPNHAAADQYWRDRHRARQYARPKHNDLSGWGACSFHRFIQRNHAGVSASQCVDALLPVPAQEPENPDPCTTWQRAADVYTPGPDDLNPRQSLFDLDQQFCYAKSNLALGIQCEYVALSTLDAGPQQITCPRERDLVVCAKAQHASVGDCLACVRSHFGMGAADGGWEFEDCTTVWEGFCEASHYGGGH